MILSADASAEVAWIGASALILSALIAGIATYVTSRSRTALRGTTDSITASTTRVVNMEDMFEDMKSERNRARKEASKALERADAAEHRADRAQHRAEELEARVQLLEVQAEVYRLQHPGKAE